MAVADLEAGGLPDALDKGQIVTWVAAQVKKKRRTSGETRKGSKRQTRRPGRARPSENGPKKKAKVRAATATKMEMPAIKANAPGVEKAKPSKIRGTGSATSAKSKKNKTVAKIKRQQLPS